MPRQLSTCENWGDLQAEMEAEFSARDEVASAKGREVSIPAQTQAQVPPHARSVGYKLEPYFRPLVANKPLSALRAELEEVARNDPGRTLQETEHVVVELLMHGHQLVDIPRLAGIPAIEVAAVAARPHVKAKIDELVQDAIQTSRRLVTKSIRVLGDLLDHGKPEVQLAAIDRIMRLNPDLRQATEQTTAEDLVKAIMAKATPTLVQVNVAVPPSVTHEEPRLIEVENDQHSLQ